MKYVLVIRWCKRKYVHVKHHENDDHAKFEEEVVVDDEKVRPKGDGGAGGVGVVAQPTPVLWICRGRLGKVLPVDQLGPLALVVAEIEVKKVSKIVECIRRKSWIKNGTVTDAQHGCENYLRKCAELNIFVANYSLWRQEITRNVSCFWDAFEERTLSACKNHQIRLQSVPLTATINFEKEKKMCPMDHFQIEHRGKIVARVKKWKMTFPIFVLGTYSNAGVMTCPTRLQKSICEEKRVLKIEFSNSFSYRKFVLKAFFCHYICHHCSNSFVEIPHMWGGVQWCDTIRRSPLVFATVVATIFFALRKFTMSDWWKTIADCVQSFLTIRVPCKKLRITCTCPGRKPSSSLPQWTDSRAL